VTYGSFVVDIKDHKEEKERTRLTVGGDQIEYPGDKSTRTAGLTTAKILINSVISTPGAKFLVVDMKNFYLNTPLAQDRKVYIEIQKGMCSLPQAGILTNELLQRNLTKYGYRPTTHTHGLWTHDFGVKYVGREHAEHLTTCIREIITFPATGMAQHTVA
jgi:hypothetical protein